MNENVAQLVALAKRVAPPEGYFDGYSLISVLESDSVSMAQFRELLFVSTAEDLVFLEGDQEYGRIIAEAADALDLLPDDPKHFKTVAQLDAIPANEVLRELCSACILNDVNSVRYLAAKTDVNALDHNKQSPLCYAVGNNHIQCVQLLLLHGADPNFIQNWGNTAMHICATSVATKAVFDLLLTAGGDLSIRNDFGKTPVDEMGRKRRKEWSC